MAIPPYLLKDLEEASTDLDVKKQFKKARLDMENLMSKRYRESINNQTNEDIKQDDELQEKINDKISNFEFKNF